MGVREPGPLPELGPNAGPHALGSAGTACDPWGGSGCEALLCPGGQRASYRLPVAGRQVCLERDPGQQSHHLSQVPKPPYTKAAPDPLASDVD